jgi:hypothetical protein
MMRAMRIPKTLIPEVVSHVVMFLNISGMRPLPYTPNFKCQNPYLRQAGKVQGLGFKL